MATRVTFPGATDFLPAEIDLADLRAAASGCEGCDLYEQATQTVFGVGPASARMIMVGEQPGDKEDVEGIPFVGPAGKMLDRALSEAGIDRSGVYVTNAVKHFRWKPSPYGQRRLHEKPAASHINACRPWLVAEVQATGPQVVVALGATAAQALFGPGFKLTQNRGSRLSWPPEKGAFADISSSIEVAFATIHPSAILRADDDQRESMFAGMVSDLRLAQQALS